MASPAEDLARLARSFDKRIKTKLEMKIKSAFERKRLGHENVEDKRLIGPSFINVTLEEIYDYFISYVKRPEVTVNMKIDGFWLRAEVTGPSLVMMLKGGARATLHLEPDLKDHLIAEFNKVFPPSEEEVRTRVFICELARGDAPRYQGKFALNALQELNYHIRNNKLGKKWCAMAELKLYIVDILGMTPRELVRISSAWETKHRNPGSILRKGYDHDTVVRPVPGKVVNLAAYTKEEFLQLLGPTCNKGTLTYELCNGEEGLVIKVADEPAAVWTDKQVGNVAVKVKPQIVETYEIVGVRAKTNGQISLQVSCGDEERWTYPVAERDVSGVGLNDEARCKLFGWQWNEELTLENARHVVLMFARKQQHHGSTCAPKLECRAGAKEQVIDGAQVNLADSAKVDGVDHSGADALGCGAKRNADAISNDTGEKAPQKQQLSWDVSVQNRRQHQIGVDVSNLLRDCGSLNKSKQETLLVDMKIQNTILPKMKILGGEKYGAYHVTDSDGTRHSFQYDRKDLEAIHRQFWMGVHNFRKKLTCCASAKASKTTLSKGLEEMAEQWPVLAEGDTAGAAAPAGAASKA